MLRPAPSLLLGEIVRAVRIVMPFTI
jgi:hypothetical protein